MFEQGINPIIAEKMTSERSRDYMTARRVAKEYEANTRGLNKAQPCVPPTGSQEEIRQVETAARHSNRRQDGDESNSRNLAANKWGAATLTHARIVHFGGSGFLFSSFAIDLWIFVRNTLHYSLSVTAWWVSDFTVIWLVFFYYLEWSIFFSASLVISNRAIIPLILFFCRKSLESAVFTALHLRTRAFFFIIRCILNPLSEIDSFFLVTNPSKNTSFFSRGGSASRIPSASLPSFRPRVKFN